VATTTTVTARTMTMMSLVLMTAGEEEEKKKILCLLVARRQVYAIYHMQKCSIKFLLKGLKGGHIMPPGVSVISQLPCDYLLVTSQVGMST